MSRSAVLLVLAAGCSNHPGPSSDVVSSPALATPLRNTEGRWRMSQEFVELLLPAGNEFYQHLDRVLAQSEESCIVTQSVRQGIELQVTVRDARGHLLLGDKSFEAGS